MDEREPMDDGELARRLEAYAAAALRPDPRATARSRASVVAAARAAGPVATPVATTAVSARRPVWRRTVALLAAAAVALVLAGGALAASAPGGALYDVRLAIEDATLPGDPDARAEAQADRLERRVAEIQAAAASGDTAALQAAVAAYRAIVDEALDDPSAGARATADLEAVLQRHLLVLAGVLADAPGAAHQGLERAIERSDRALDQLDERTDGKPGVGPDPSKGPAASPAAPSKGPAASPAAPSKGPDPSKGPPDKSPKPDKSPPPSGAGESSKP